MKTNRILAVVLLMALLPVLPVQAEERTFVPTAQWEPPEIVPEEVLESQPWLLALKIAQEEVGYIEGPGKNESKYGTWFGKEKRALVRRISQLVCP